MISCSLPLSRFSSAKFPFPNSDLPSFYHIPETPFHFFLGSFLHLLILPMTEQRDNHVVEIPVDAEPQKQNLFAEAATLGAIQHHPLTEISKSPGHLLLLKLWQREEDLHGHRIGGIETRLESIKREAFQLCCLFFAFHGILLTLLFTSSTNQSEERGACKNWWVPSCLSLVTSLVLVCVVQIKICGYWKVWRHLQRERTDGRALTRCIQELRMKGASFDLSKEPQASKRMKSSSVEINWRPLRWCSQNLVTMFLLCFTGMIFPACKFILCS